MSRFASSCSLRGPHLHLKRLGRRSGQHSSRGCALCHDHPRNQRGDSPGSCLPAAKKGPQNRLPVDLYRATLQVSPLRLTCNQKPSTGQEKRTDLDSALSTGQAKRTDLDSALSTGQAKRTDLDSALSTGQAEGAWPVIFPPTGQKWAKFQPYDKPFRRLSRSWLPARGDKIICQFISVVAVLATPFETPSPHSIYSILLGDQRSHRRLR